MVAMATVSRWTGGAAKQRRRPCHDTPEAPSLARLSAEENPQKTILRFELATLREIGQLPAFDACLVCGTPIQEDLPFSFWVSQSGLICRNCQKDDHQHLRLHPGTLAVLNRLAADSDAGLDRLTVSPAQLQELRPVLTAAISHILGHRPKTARYLTTPRRP